MRPKGVLAFDIDGTLTRRNTYNILPPQLPELLNQLDDLGIVSVPVTGKPTLYAERVMRTSHLRDMGIVAENAGVYRRPRSKKIEVYGASLGEMQQLRTDLGITGASPGVRQIFLNSKGYEVVVEPEDVSILTVFTDPSYVRHRWQFQQTIEAERLCLLLGDLIKERGWSTNLEVLKPFPDGAVQVIRKDPQTGLTINKSRLSDVVRIMYELDSPPPIAMFGDGHNDIPAMQSEGVIPITFTNAEEEVKRYAREHGGYVSDNAAPEGNGVIQGMWWLLEKMSITNQVRSEIRRRITKVFP